MCLSHVQGLAHTWCLLGRIAYQAYQKNAAMLLLYSGPSCLVVVLPHSVIIQFGCALASLPGNLRSPVIVQNVICMHCQYFH